MTITTIKLNKSTKYALKEIKYEKESYDTAVRRLIYKIKSANLKYELIEAYKENAKENLRILKEWENTSNELN